MVNTPSVAPVRLQWLPVHLQDKCTMVRRERPHPGVRLLFASIHASAVQRLGFLTNVLHLYMCCVSVRSATLAPKQTAVQVHCALMAGLHTQTHTHMHTHTTLSSSHTGVPVSKPWEWFAQKPLQYNRLWNAHTHAHTPQKPISHSLQMKLC